MFDGCVGELDPDAALAVAADLRACVHRAEAQLLEIAAHWADLHPPEILDRLGDSTVLPGTERVVVHGGDGCPGVTEFACADLGAALGVTSGSAAALMSDALGLRHRLPRTWAGVLEGRVQAWRARQIAVATVAINREAAAIVDAQVAGIADRVTPYRLKRIVDAAVLATDPELAAKNAEESARSRGVWLGRADENGSRSFGGKVAAGDAARFHARISQVADILADLGDADPVELRRAKAVGWLADPHACVDLITLATTRHTQPPGPEEPGPEPGPEPAVGGGAQASVGSELTAVAERAQVLARLRAGRPAGPTGAAGAVRALGSPLVVYVHLTDHTLASGEGLIRTETRGTGLSDADLGPLLASQLTELIGPGRGTIVVKPVIDLRDRISVDAYEIPDRIREAVRLRYPVCYFPWCNRPAVTSDLDHVTPYCGLDGLADSTGPPGQTGTETLAPACRFHHRVKTHGRWQVERTPDGAFLWTSPHGSMYLVDHTGTRVLRSRGEAGRDAADAA